MDREGAGTGHTWWGTLGCAPGTPGPPLNVLDAVYCIFYVLSRWQLDKVMKTGPLLHYIHPQSRGEQIKLHFFLECTTSSAVTSRLRALFSHRYLAEAAKCRLELAGRRNHGVRRLLRSFTRVRSSPRTSLHRTRRFLTLFTWPHIYTIFLKVIQVAQLWPECHAIYFKHCPLFLTYLSQPFFFCFVSWVKKANLWWSLSLL